MRREILAVVLALQVFCIAGMTCCAQSPECEEAFVAVHLVNAELQITEQLSNSDGKVLPRETTMVDVVRDGAIWGVRNTKTLDALVQREYVATRGEECLRLSYVEDENHVNEIDMVLTSERVGGKESKTLLQQIFPNNYLQLIPLGALHGRLIDRDCFDGASVTNVNNGQVRIKSKLDIGEFEAVCDPNQGHLPIRMTLMQTGSHLHNGRPLNSIVMKGGGVFFAGKIQSNRIEVDDIECARFSKGWYIKSWRLKEVLTAESGGKVTTVQHGNVKNIGSGSPLKTAALFFDAPIPDRQSVGVDGAVLDYVWDGMWAVPDTAALKNFPPPSRSTSSVWLLPGLAILVVSIGAFSVRKKLGVS